jgi:hypothetical protein
VRELPREVVLEDRLAHPDYPWFGKYGLRWHAVPAISDLMRVTPDEVFPCAPFNEAVLHSFTVSIRSAPGFRPCCSNWKHGIRGKVGSFSNAWPTASRKILLVFIRRIDEAPVAWKVELVPHGDAFFRPSPSPTPS